MDPNYRPVSTYNFWKDNYWKTYSAEKEVDSCKKDDHSSQKNGGSQSKVDYANKGNSTSK